MKACNGSAGKIPLAFLCSALVAGEWPAPCVDHIGPGESLPI
jgi:hypothetical protein